MTSASTSITPSQAAKLFLRPQKKRNPADPTGLPDSQRNDFEFEGLKLAFWQAGAGPMVFLLHGWEGSSADMTQFVAPLLSAGFSVAALDLPAHGASEGTLVSLFQFTRATKQLLDHIGHPHAFIAHSVGCPVVIEAIHAGINVNAVVLIGTPARYKDQAFMVASQLGLDRDGTKQMLEELKSMDVDVSAINTPAAVRDLKVPGLIIHSEDDKVIPQVLGKEVADAWPGARFMSMSGLGHRRILSSSEVIAAAVEFVGSAK
jgi:pimeloyl-ACP methyl ester carboxylesterase